MVNETLRFLNLVYAVRSGIADAGVTGVTRRICFDKVPMPSMATSLVAPGFIDRGAGAGAAGDQVAGVEDHRLRLSGCGVS